jgi:hypothetical protein
VFKFNEESYKENQNKCALFAMIVLDKETEFCSIIKMLMGFCKKIGRKENKFVK